MHDYRITLGRAALIASACLGGTAMAAGPQPTVAFQARGPAPQEAPVHAPAPASTGAEATIPGMGRPMALDDLGGLRGGDGTSVDNNINIDGEVTDNHAEDIVTGANIVDGGSFGNAAGVSTVIQNSGANVLIQNATIVNVQFTDPSP